MKVLIWIGCFFVATILNTILGYATGVKVGYLIFYFAVYFVAKKLCNKWDEHKEEKAERKKATQQQNIVVKEKATAEDVDQVRFAVSVAKNSSTTADFVVSAVQKSLIDRKVLINNETQAKEKRNF